MSRTMYAGWIFIVANLTQSWALAQEIGTSPVGDTTGLMLLGLGSAPAVGPTPDPPASPIGGVPEPASAAPRSGRALNFSSQFNGSYNDLAGLARMYARWRDAYDRAREDLGKAFGRLSSVSAGETTGAQQQVEQEVRRLGTLVRDLKSQGAQIYSRFRQVFRASPGALAASPPGFNTWSGTSRSVYGEYLAGQPYLVSRWH